MPESLLGSQELKGGQFVQVAFVQSNATQSLGNPYLANTDIIPTNASGSEIYTLAITPKSATNVLMLEGVISLGNSGVADLRLHLFKDAVVNALATFNYYNPGNNDCVMAHFIYTEVAGDIATRTYKIRYTHSNNGSYINMSGDGGRNWGGTQRSIFRITEIRA